MGWVGAVVRIAPGLAMLRGYRREWLGHDVVAGVSVAAVALPTAIAYSELAGFPPVVGLYASILPLITYMLFGSSRQLIVNPDAATCAMVAAIVVPLAGGNAGTYLSLTVTLAALTGIALIAAGIFKLGFLADFLPRPVLVGFINGIAISIFLGQIGKVLGFPIESAGILPRIIEIASKLPQTHLPTLAVGLGTLAAMFGARRFSPRLPAPLIALVAAVVAVKALLLERMGVAVVGSVPGGLPDLRIPLVPLEYLEDLLAGAVGLALIIFTSGMATARSFAARNRYEIDANRELIAFGACNLAAGLSQGFAVTGADSRTAVNDVMGGKSQLAGLVAAGTMTLILLFFTEPLASLPVAGLGAVLIAAALELFDLGALMRLRRIQIGEFAVSLIAMFGVVAIGAIHGIAVAVGLALLLLLIRASRPSDAVLGRIPEMRGFHDVAYYGGAATIPGLVLYRFGAGIIFFNAPYFRRRVLDVLAAKPGTKWLVVDGAPIVHIDSTGADVIAALAYELEAHGVRLAFANLRRPAREMLKRAGSIRNLGAGSFFQTLNSAIRAFQTSQTETDN